MISTKDLYLVELRIVENIEYNSLGHRVYFKDKARFALCKKKHDISTRYFDIFTKTEYNLDKDCCTEGEEVITSCRAVITTKKYLTKNETTEILKVINPTYLPKILTKKK